MCRMKEKGKRVRVSWHRLAVLCLGRVGGSEGQRDWEFRDGEVNEVKEEIQ